MAEPSILGALRDPQFRSDTLRNLVEALHGAKRSLTVGSLGAAGDMGSTLANLVRAGAGTAYHEATGRPIPQALEYRDPARDVGTSASLGSFAEAKGWLPPQTYSMPEQAGALLGPIAAMKAPDLAQSTLRGLVSALKSEPSRRMIDNLVDATGARFNAVPDQPPGISTKITDETGAPLKVYHGSGSDFDVFDKNKRGSNTGANGAREAFFFADSRGNAHFYADKAEQQGGGWFIHEANLDSKNPLVLGHDDARSSVRGTLLEDLSNSDPKAIEYAKNNGYDAVIWPFGNLTNAEWTAAVFEPEQIKLLKPPKK